MMTRNKEADIKKTITDVIVIGGGGTGLAAAVAAAESGAKVIVLEKRKVPGGTSAMAGGIFAAESPFQKRMMIEASSDDLFKKAMEYTHWKTNPRIVRAFVDKSGDTVRWLEEKGLEFAWIPPMYPNQVPQVLHWPEGQGAALIRVLINNCENLGVEIYTQAPAKKIMTDGKGKVSGVLVDVEQNEFRIAAKSTIIATGGYGGNKKLLKKYCLSYHENMHCGGIPNMGDGITMAAGLGAATEGLGLLLLNGPTCLGSRLLSSVVGEPSPILVNKKGERFADENILSHFERGNPLDRQPDKISYSLFDAKIKKDILEAGLRRPGWGLPRAKWHLQPQIEPCQLENDLKAEAEKGNVKISDSWEVIAEWMGVGTSVLNATIEEYNTFCGRKHDSLFVKDPKYLLPLRTPPYYAIKCVSSFHGTIGGIKINHRMEVLNQKEDPIPGLYAGGTDTGGWQGDTYCGRDLPGIAFGFAINSGRIAGENAAKYVLG